MATTFRNAPWAFARAWRPAVALPWLAPLLMLAVLAVNPIGYVGTGADDYVYLQHARCWVAHGGPCLAGEHWGTRWPVIAPMAASIGLLGESRFSVGLSSLLWWALAVGALGAIGRRWFDEAAGALAAAMLAVVPVIAMNALAPGADVPELALQLLALALATRAAQDGDRWSALGAGIAAAVAFQVRETSIVFLALSAAALLWLPQARRPVLLWALPGFALAMGAEWIAYALATGDPFARYAIAMGHSARFTSELAPGVDRSQSPILNPAFIAGWRREMGITLWWPVDPWLNMLASPRVGATVVAGAAALLLWGRRLAAQDRRRLALAIGGAALVSCGLIYGLAVDPKARMFLDLAAAMTLALGAATVAAWRSGERLLPVLLLGALMAFQLTVLGRELTTHGSEAAARQWIAAYPGQVEIDPSASNMLTLVPEARALPKRGTGRPMVIAVTPSRCEALVGHASTVRLVAADTRASAGRAGLCLFRYR